MNYGELLGTYDPEKDIVYSEISNYFNNPLMSKVKDVSNYSMYISKVHCLLRKDYRYIICFVPVDKYNVGNKLHLSDLHWISFQTRTLTETYEELPYHKYKPIRNNFSNIEIKILEKDNSKFTYTCKDLPINITLLTPNKSSFYQDKGCIAAALETYNTILNFTH